MRRRHPRVRTALEHWSEEISVFFAGGTPRRRQFLEDPVVLKAAMYAVRAVKWKIRLFIRTMVEAAGYMCRKTKVNISQFR